MIKPNMPERFEESFRLWWQDGIRPGSFFLSVLQNDLRQALAHADPVSVHELPGIVAWLYAYADASCWGSVETVAAHYARRKAEREAAKDA